MNVHDKLFAGHLYFDNVRGTDSIITERDKRHVSRVNSNPSWTCHLRKIQLRLVKYIRPRLAQ